mmetsp:Transcript_35301/g.101713  ORF Transcript_35301/g.101713 Transcript_35301/m.101713 type:complete len:128 (-) Transcript_35301:635-1018(-)
MNLIFTDKMHGQLINGKGKILQCTVGSVSGSNNHFGLIPRQFFSQFQLESKFILLFGTQMAFHGSDKGPSTQGNVIQILLTSFWIDITIIIAVGHADQITRVVNVHSPVLSGFVPTLVRRIGTESQQ